MRQHRGGDRHQEQEVLAADDEEVGESSALEVVRDGGRAATRVTDHETEEERSLGLRQDGRTPFEP